MSEPYDDEDDGVCADCGELYPCECDVIADCGRWRNGKLTQHCTKAGSEDCDFECPLRG